MALNKIYLNNFRNLKQLSLSFNKPITIFYGDNGQGKTNIVEAIYLLANTTSFRTSNFKELISYQNEQAFVEGDFLLKQRNEKYKVILNKSGKSVSINDMVITKLSDYIGKIKAVCFSPEDVSLFKDSPGSRRSFLDKELSSLFPLYIRQLINFKSVLEQRNALLKENADDILLEVLNEKLVESSYDVYKRRKWLLTKLEEFATKIFQQITSENQKIKIEYYSFLKEDNKELYLNKAIEIYQNNIKKDKEKQYTIVGIHKDDFKVFLNEYQIDMYASQGQQRLISLCLKLAVVEIITKADNQEPIIILDDAFSELDAKKKEKLMNYVINKKQVFITCTDYRNIVLNNNVSNIKLINVKDGKIVERSVI